MPEAAHTGYLNLIKRSYKDDEELRLAAAKVQETLDSEGWQIIRRLLHDVHESYFKTLILGPSAIRGDVPSQAEFARATGFLAGIEQPQTAAESFAHAVEAMRRANESPE